MSLATLAEPGRENGNFKGARNRRILDLVDGGMTYADTAAALGVTVPIVKNVVKWAGGRLSPDDVAWADEDAPPQLTDVERDARAAVAALRSMRRDLELEDGALAEEVQRMTALIAEAGLRRVEIASACAALTASLSMLDRASG